MPKHIGYDEALRRQKEATNLAVAELFYENCVGDPHVTDKDGNWLTKEQVYEKLKRGDEE